MYHNANALDVDRFSTRSDGTKGEPQGKGEDNSYAKMPTLVINRRLTLDRDHIQGFMSEQIHSLVRIYNVCGVQAERDWDLVYDIIFLDPVTTPHLSQFQVMWPHCRSRSSPFREWWAAFGSYMGQMFDKTRQQMSNWRWDNPRAIGDQVDCSNPQTPSSGRFKRTGEHFSWYGSDDLSAKIEPPICRQYKPGDFLAVTPLHWEEIIDEDDDDVNWADSGVLSCEQSCPGDDNDNDDGKGEEDLWGGEKWTGKGKGTKDGEGQEKGKGKGNGKGKGIVEMYEADLDTEG